MKKNNADRRNFIKNATVLGFGVPVSLATISQAQANTSSSSSQSIVNSKENNIQAENEFSIFITINK